MSDLTRHFQRRIRAEGPITLADFMADCLTHPEGGYYTTRGGIGAAGDFVTAPEISQMFGELLGLALAQAWMDQGAPERVVLAELGPGRGTLMADLLRATARVPGFRAAAEVHLVEISPTLRAAQRAALSDTEVHWHDRLDDLPENRPLFLVANEYFDALPIRQFRRDGTAWRERTQGLNPDGALIFGWSPPKKPAALAGREADATDGDIVEICAPARAEAGRIAARIATSGGAAILVDYGDWRSLGDTFQAVRGHATADPLAAPGTADLTAHVDFEPLAEAARAAGAAHSRLVPQGVFLERLGITARANALAGALGGDALQAHIAAHRRLTHPAEMGTLFKAMAFYPKTAPCPPGFDA